MFEFVRRHTKLMQLMLFVLIVPSFVLFGIDGYTRLSDGGATVAEFAGQTIKQAQWDDAHRRQIDFLRSQQPDFDLGLLDSPQAKYATLERLLQDRLIETAQRDLRVEISDQRLSKVLQQDPSIKALRKPDGSLDLDQYRQVAAAQGFTPEGLEANLRLNLARRQVLSAITDTGVLPEVISNIALAAFFEGREVAIAHFKPEAHLAAIKPSPEDLKAHLQKYPSRYQSPPTADIEYVVLDMSAVERDIVLSESDLRTYFQQNQESLAAKEERRASHILIRVGKDHLDRDQALAKAQSVLEQIRKAPKDFAELARVHSLDPGSANQGGDLDFFNRGAMVKPFEDAVFKMSVGDISEPIETEFGFHIIKLTDIRKPKAQTFEQARPELETELMRQQARLKYAQAAEKFSNLVYEQPDSLQPAADGLNLKILSASGVSPETQLKAPWANPKALAAIFSADAIERKHNTQAIEIGPNLLLSARVVQHAPGRALTPDEVGAQLSRDWLQEKTTELAQQKGRETLKQWQEQPATATFKPAITITRDKPGDIPPDIIAAAFKAPADTLPAMVGVDLKAQGYAIVKVNKIMAATELEQRKNEREFLAKLNATFQTQAYQQYLKDRLKARILAEKPGRISSEGL